MSVGQNALSENFAQCIFCSFSLINKHSTKERERTGGLEGIEFNQNDEDLRDSIKTERLGVYGGCEADLNKVSSSSALPLSMELVHIRFLLSDMTGKT
ncbi:hypothetical protein L1887_12210 [Cichorium endivia]|nr:hypothetical protein L1887_12210 [Cichorium endivia]